MMYARDVVLFLLGIVLILKQAGILFPPPESVSMGVLCIGALFCNGPLVLQYLTITRGGSGSREDSAPSGPAPPSESSSAPSSGGE
jgi:hypothetical protein